MPMLHGNQYNSATYNNSLTAIRRNLAGLRESGKTDPRILDTLSLLHDLVAINGAKHGVPITEDLVGTKLQILS